MKVFPDPAYAVEASVTALQTTVAAITPASMDLWTHVVLGSDFSTTSLTAVNVTGLKFTPAANGRYLFRAVLLTRASLTTIGAQIGLTWPTGLTDAVGEIRSADSTKTVVYGIGNKAGAFQNLPLGISTTTDSWPAFIEGLAVAGASPSGDVQVTLNVSLAGTATLKAGSVLSYRTI